MKPLLSVTTAALAAVLSIGPARAAVGPEEAARLKKDLTPTGAERAGNKDGTIPAWNGGFTGKIPGDDPKGRRGDPFKDEKPLLSITAQNVQQHADKLTDGAKALLAKYPEFRIDVYPTHRTAAAPAWVYDNIAKNAVNASLVDGSLKGAFGGIPFPIPQNGAEAIWNHMLRWQGTSWRMSGTQYVITADGRAVLTVDLDGQTQMPYYYKESSAEAFAKTSGDYWLYRSNNLGPPVRAGEALVARNNVGNDKDQGWVYLQGQRRVRKLPQACCDTPTTTSSGVLSYDEIFGWQGTIKRFDWKLVGKQELYIPYNNNKMFQPGPDAERLGRNFIKPEYVRWERHRVWVVEATLKAGQRHQAARSRYYLDEDTWQVALADRWDAQGQLWKSLWVPNFVAPDFPGTLTFGYGQFDLLSGASFFSMLPNNKAAPYVLEEKRFEENHFTPDSLAGEGVR